MGIKVDGEHMDANNTEENIIHELIKKSEMDAKSIYDFKKICLDLNYFVPCTLEETKEEVEFSFCTDYLKRMDTIRQEAQLQILAVLLNASNLEKVRKKYKFKMSPENLYYDANFCVKIKIRDIYDENEIRADEFIKEYKALIGYALQKKYTYFDYLEGGLEVLKKTSDLKSVYDAETVEDIKKYLENKYIKIQNTMQQTTIIVSKKGRKSSKIYSFICTIWLIAAIGYIAFLSVETLPKDKALIAASNAFVELDYIAVIDSLELIPVEELEVHAKYMLAVSYIKAENLNMEQKNNILADTSVMGDEKILNYWIYLGRLNTVEAINIALQSSDDELLLYGYLKEKSLVESDATITGEVKIEKLNQLESKIQEITKKYEGK